MNNTTVVNGVVLTEKRLKVLAQWFDNNQEELIVSYVTYMDIIKNTLTRIICDDRDSKYKDEILESLSCALSIQDDFKELVKEETRN